MTDPELQALRNQIRSHELLHARIAEALGRVIWDGDVATAVYAEVDRANGNALSCRHFAVALRRIAEGGNAAASEIALEALRMPWISKGHPLLGESGGTAS